MKGCENMKKTKWIGFRIEEDLHKKLTKAAEVEDRSMSNIMQHLIKKYLVLKNYAKRGIK